METWGGGGRGNARQEKKYAVLGHWTDQDG